MRRCEKYEMAHSMKYTYDPVDLIELVEQRRCLWDKSIEDYKDRNKKLKAWTEVHRYLINEYENLEEQAKVTAGKAINEKWKHIRDAFALSLKKKSGDKRSKKYIYSDQLQFLLKILEKDDTVSSMTENKENVSEDEGASVSSHVPLQPINIDQCMGMGAAIVPKRKKVLQYDDTDKALLKALEATSKAPDADEDSAFFTSITPSVRNFSEDEKLEFRMGVLTLIKNIKEKRSRPSSNTSYNTSYSSYSTTVSDYHSPDYMYENI